MPYPSSVHTVYAAPRSKVAFIYSTKDRGEFTRQTFPAVAAASGFDIIWCDGSKTEDGKNLPAEFLTAPNLKEIHYGVTGGPDAAITYGLTYGLAQGYDYIGLIENDVLLAPGWFDAMFALFAKGEADGLTVGSVSARTYPERVLGLHKDYAVMFNVGAGMLLLTRDAAQALLQNYRTSTLQDIWQTAYDMAGTDVSTHWEHLYMPDMLASHWLSADWWYDAALLRQGFASLGMVPSMASVVDPIVLTMHFHDMTVADIPSIPPLDFQRLQNNLADVRTTVPSSISYLNQFQYSAGETGWIVFPHQLAAALPDAFQGTWRSKWSQSYGPFSAVAGDNAVLSLPVAGSPLIPLFTNPPPTDIYMQATLDGRVENLPFYRENMDRVPLAFPTGWEAASQFTLAPPPGSILTSLICLTPQPWMVKPLPFDFSAIQNWFD